MFFTFEDYESEPMSISFEEMAALHREMSEEIGGDRDALDLYGELLNAAVRYLYSRAYWPLWNQREKAQIPGAALAPER